MNGGGFSHPPDFVAKNLVFLSSPHVEDGGVYQHSAPKQRIVRDPSNPYLYISWPLRVSKPHPHSQSILCLHLPGVTPVEYPMGSIVRIKVNAITSTKPRLGGVRIGNLPPPGDVGPPALVPTKLGYSPVKPSWPKATSPGGLYTFFLSRGLTPFLSRNHGKVSTLFLW